MSLAVNLPSVFVYFHFSLMTLPSAKVLFFVEYEYVTIGTGVGGTIITALITSLADILPSVYVIRVTVSITLPSL